MLIGLDNIQRKPKDEENLNTLFYKMFNTLTLRIGLDRGGAGLRGQQRKARLFYGKQSVLQCLTLNIEGQCRTEPKL